MEIKEYYTMAELGEMMGITQEQARSACKAKGIELVPVGRFDCIRRVDAEKLLGHSIIPENKPAESIHTELPLPEVIEANKRKVKAIAERGAC